MDDQPEALRRETSRDVLGRTPGPRSPRSARLQVCGFAGAHRSRARNPVVRPLIVPVAVTALTKAASSRTLKSQARCVTPGLLPSGLRCGPVSQFGVGIQPANGIGVPLHKGHLGSFVPLQVTPEILLEDMAAPPLLQH